MINKIILAYAFPPYPRLAAATGNTNGQKIPPGSDFDDEVNTFFKQKDAQINEIKRNEEIKTAEKNVLLWLFYREKGDPSADDYLRSALGNWENIDAYGVAWRPSKQEPGTNELQRVDLWRSRALWRAKLALMLITEMTEANRNYTLTLLRRHPFNLSPQNPSAPLFELKIELYQQLLGSMPKGSDPLLLGEVYFQLGIMQKKLGQDPSSNFTYAQRQFQLVVDKNQQLISSLSYVFYDRNLANDVYNQEYLPQARARLALLTLLMKDNPTNEELEDALEQVRNARDNLKNAYQKEPKKLVRQQFNLLEFNLLEAECLVRLRRGEEAIPLLQENINWLNAYIQKVTSPCQWAKEMTVLSYFWLAKARLSNPSIDPQTILSELSSVPQKTKQAITQAMPETWALMHVAIYARLAVYQREQNNPSWQGNLTNALEWLKKISEADVKKVANTELLDLADIANWNGNFDEAKNLYEEISNDPASPLDVKLRAELGLAEVQLRQQSLKPRQDLSQAAQEVIKAADRILESSEDPFLIERALQSKVEALIALKEKGLGELEKMRDKLLNTDFDIQKYLGKKVKLANPKLEEDVKALLSLQVADGFLSIQRYDEAKEIIEGLEEKYKDVFRKNPTIKAHCLLISAEIALRSKPDDKEAIRNIEEAAKTIISLQNDPYLVERVIKDLVDIYATQGEFEKTLVLAYLTYLPEDKAREELEKLGGTINRDKLEDAINFAKELLKGVNIESIFKSKSLMALWNQLTLKLRLKQVEILILTGNLEPALALLSQLKEEEEETICPLQKSRILILLGNNTQEKKDFKQALNYFLQAESILNNLTDPNPSQEQILIRAELYISLADIYRYGRNTRDLRQAIYYYRVGEQWTNQITGNDNLKYYHLARIYLGLAKIAEILGHITLDGKEYWPSELLEKAKQYNSTNNQTLSELQSTYQNSASNWKHPRLQLETTAFRYKNATEMRLGLTLTEPFQFRLLEGMREIDAIFRMNNDFDLKSGSILQAYYAGLRFKPSVWLWGEANFRAGAKILRTKGDAKSHFLNNPNLHLVLGLRSPWDVSFLRGLSSTFAADLFFYENRLNSYYWDVNYNFGRDFNNPFLQGLTLGLGINYFGFKYGDQFPRRLRIMAPSVRYELDLKELDVKDHPSWPYGLVKLILGGSFIYEYLLNQSGSNLGFNLNVALMLNLGYFNLMLYYTYERMYQNPFRRNYYTPEPFQELHLFGIGVTFPF